MSVSMIKDLPYLFCLFPSRMDLDERPAIRPYFVCVCVIMLRTPARRISFALTGFGSSPTDSDRSPTSLRKRRLLSRAAIMYPRRKSSVLLILLCYTPFSLVDTDRSTAGRACSNPVPDKAGLSLGLLVLNSIMTSYRCVHSVSMSYIRRGISLLRTSGRNDDNRRTRSHNALSGSSISEV